MAVSGERRLKKLLESDGYHVVRSAGSQAVDLVAINRKTGDSMLIEEKEFWGKTFSVHKTRKYLDQWREMLKIQEEMNGHTGVFYALRKKGQNEWRFVHPDVLVKPYHWNQEEEHEEVHST